MFEYLKGYRVVLVSGPHRSGTTITAKMIAHDTGLRFFPEEAFGHDNVEGWRALVEATQGGAIQCPTMCYRIGQFGKQDNVAVVMVWRDLAEIQASQAKVGWMIGGGYDARYKAELARYGKMGGNLAQLKYRHWENQKPLILHAYDVQYASLSAHPLWIPKAERAGFGPRQVTR